MTISLHNKLVGLPQRTTDQKTFLPISEDPTVEDVGQPEKTEMRQVLLLKIEQLLVEGHESPDQQQQSNADGQGGPQERSQSQEYEKKQQQEQLADTKAPNQIESNQSKSRKRRSSGQLSYALSSSNNQQTTNQAITPTTTLNQSLADQPKFPVIPHASYVSSQQTPAADHHLNRHAIGSSPSPQSMFPGEATGTMDTQISLGNKTSPLVDTASNNIVSLPKSRSKTTQQYLSSQVFTIFGTNTVEWPNADYSIQQRRQRIDAYADRVQTQIKNIESGREGERNVKFQNTRSFMTPSGYFSGGLLAAGYDPHEKITVTFTTYTGIGTAENLNSTDKRSYFAWEITAGALEHDRPERGGPLNFSFMHIESEDQSQVNDLESLGKILQDHWKKEIITPMRNAGEIMERRSGKADAYVVRGTLQSLCNNQDNFEKISDEGQEAVRRTLEQNGQVIIPNIYGYPLEGYAFIPYIPYDGNYEHRPNQGLMINLRRGVVHEVHGDQSFANWAQLNRNSLLKSFNASDAQGGMDAHWAKAGSVLDHLIQGNSTYLGYLNLVSDEAIRARQTFNYTRARGKGYQLKYGPLESNDDTSIASKYQSVNTKNMVWSDQTKVFDSSQRSWKAAKEFWGNTFGYLPIVGNAGNIVFGVHDGIYGKTAQDRIGGNAAAVISSLQLTHEIVPTAVEAGLGAFPLELNRVARHDYSWKVNPETNDFELVQEAQKASNKPFFHSPQDINGQVGYPMGPTKPPKLARLEEPSELTPEALSAQIRTSGYWNHQSMDMVPFILTNLREWPQDSSLVIIDSPGMELGNHHHWSVRYSPGGIETYNYDPLQHPEESAKDIVLYRTNQNHYDVLLKGKVVPVVKDGDCLFRAIATALNTRSGDGVFSVEMLRNAAADYVNQHPEMIFLGENNLNDVANAQNVEASHIILRPVESPDAPSSHSRKLGLIGSEYESMFKHTTTHKTSNKFYPFVLDQAKRKELQKPLADASPLLEEQTNQSNIQAKVEKFSHEWKLPVDITSLPFFKMSGVITTEIKNMDGALIANLINKEENAQPIIRRIIEPMSGSGAYANYARVIGFKGELQVNGINPLISFTQKEIIEQPDRVKYYIKGIKKNLVNLANDAFNFHNGESKISFNEDKLSYTAASAQEANQIVNSLEALQFRNAVRRYFNDVILHPGSGATAHLSAEEVRAYRAAAFYIVQNNATLNSITCINQSGGLNLPLSAITRDQYYVRLFNTSTSNIDNLNYLSYIHNSSPGKTIFSTQNGWEMLRSPERTNEGDLAILSGHFSNQYLSEADFMQKIEDYLVPFVTNHGRVIITNSFSDFKKAKFEELGFRTFVSEVSGKKYLLAVNESVAKDANL